MDLPPELAGLPEPALVDDLSYANIKTAFIARLKAEFDAVGIDYDVDMLQTDPGVILMQVAAYIDTNLRQRINEAIKSWFLAYARGGDLDVLAQWYDVTRMVGETDDALRSRIVLAIKGRSPGGTEDRYKFIARSADVRVADASVYRVGRDPTVHVAVFSTDNSGVADATLLAKVDAALQSSAVRMVNDTIVVASAARQAGTITANYWLLPSANQVVVEAAMRASLAAAWAADMVLGRDVIRSWVLSKLQVAGVQKVELVGFADVAIPSNQAAALGAVTLNLVGRAY
ncbi:hypothetical protein JP75_06635 [Devosia riboflavina]|uniref:Baseplate J-like central domain-containing protein n=1 Tax=Devosia riboflavina TaxID=46914 RepID=A0A087M4D4_9HYPH|nr:baseplate J/gp47 family protein [Devosia riboflavina]KFL31737.1 hypothetical protein JP75_06635 [Devosia riboflavina]